MVIHSGAATRDGDMSYLEDDFDPCRNDPRRDMPGVLDSRIDISQLNTSNFNSVDQRTAQVAVVQQGVDPTLASQLMAAQQQALQSEANALHSEVMERQRDALVSEARDQLASIEQRAADEISKKNLLLNEQAAQAMSEQKAAQLHGQSQDHRIKELSAELSHVFNFYQQCRSYVIVCGKVQCRLASSSFRTCRVSHSDRCHEPACIEHEKIG